VLSHLPRDIIAGMAWGEVELEPEVRDWLEGLDDQRWAQAMFHLDLLEERGVLLGEPYTRQLSESCGNCGSIAAASASGSATGSRQGDGS
jgi:hypothetical protein